MLKELPFFGCAGLSPFLGDSNAETFQNVLSLCYTFQEEEFQSIRSNL
jgi:hypothetical protein